MCTILQTTTYKRKSMHTLLRSQSYGMSQSEAVQSLYSQIKNKFLYFSFSCRLTVLDNYGAIACSVNSFVLQFMKHQRSYKNLTNKFFQYNAAVGMSGNL